MEHTRFVGLIFTRNGSRSRRRRAHALVRWSTSARLPMIRVRSASCATVSGVLAGRWRFVMRLEHFIPSATIWRVAGSVRRRFF
jgi:hypothetical protein